MGIIISLAVCGAIWWLLVRPMDASYHARLLEVEASGTYLQRLWVTKFLQQKRPTSLGAALMLRKVAQLSDRSPAPSVNEVLLVRHGGIYKRIDENRELFELLQERAPEFLEKHFWVEGWLKSQDGFLNDLATAIPPDATLPRFNVVEGRFPRPWPGKQ